MRERVLKTLRRYYKHVDCPIEAPAKADYGDIDVLAFEPEGHVELSDDSAIGEALGAKKWKRDRGSEEMHLALPWPVEFEDEASRLQGATMVTTTSEQLSGVSLADESSVEQGKYIQLDLHICPSKSVYDWQLFRCAHGDFWTITGSIIRRYGLSFRNSGLYVRIAEVEKVNKKLSLIQLTGTPSEVFKFLFSEGIEERYWKRDAFENVEDMCDFIRRQCKFYQPPRKREKADDDEDMELEVRKKDKNKCNKRGSFRYWLEEYVPPHSAADREGEVEGEYTSMSREEVADMVKSHFNVAKEYDEKQKIGLRQVGVEKLWADVRASISPVERVAESIHGVQGPEVNFVVRTLRRKLSIDARDKKDDELDEVQRAYREGKFDEVQKWIERNRKEVTERQQAENEEKSRIHYKQKMERTEKERADAAAAAATAVNEGERKREQEHKTRATAEMQQETNALGKHE